jgi:uncharacterized protein YraI
MKTKRRIIFILFVFPLVLSALSVPLPAVAAETSGYEVVPCDVECYVISDDPTGVKVRSGPGEEYPIIATLSTESIVTVSLQLTGTSGEWFRIADLFMVKESPTDGYEKHVDITGWVTGPVLGVRAWPLETPLVPLYEEPNTTSPVLTRLPRDAGATIIGCNGDWLKVNYKSIEGWLAPGTYCGAAFTNCI